MMVDLQEEDMQMSTVQENMDMQGGWSWRRRRRNHCGNLKTNWCQGTTCGCCPCCGRCGKLCSKWPVCYGTDMWHGPYRNACFGHDLSCGEQQWGGGGWSAVVSCIIAPVLSVVPGVLVMGWSALIGFATGFAHIHPHLYAVLSGFGSPPCGEGDACAGYSSSWGSIPSTNQYCSGTAGGESEITTWSNQSGPRRRRYYNPCTACRCCSAAEVELELTTGNAVKALPCCGGSTSFCCNDIA